MTDNSRFMKEQETARHDWPFPVYEKKDKPQDVDCNCEGFCTGVHEMTDRELFKKALDALDIAHRRHGFVDITVMTSLSQRLAQPEQEPVAYMNQSGVIHEAGYEWGPNNALTPLYAAPQPQRKPLTDAEIEAMWQQSCREHFSGLQREIHLARAIEAAHGIKGEDK